MNMLSTICAACALAAAFAAAPAAAQGGERASEHQLREHLIWNSPWEGRSLAPPSQYSYRTVFRPRRDALVAEVTSYSTHQKADSVVTIADGRAHWHDSNGAAVSVAINNSGELVGNAKSRSNDLPIALKPRP